MKKPPPVWRAAKSKIGAPISAAIKPTAWLIVFASSSLEEWAGFGKAHGSFRTLIGQDEERRSTEFGKAKTIRHLMIGDQQIEVSNQVISAAKIRLAHRPTENNVLLRPSVDAATMRTSKLLCF